MMHLLSAGAAELAEAEFVSVGAEAVAAAEAD
jgi:hypothetical protein